MVIFRANVWQPFSCTTHNTVSSSHKMYAVLLFCIFYAKKKRLPIPVIHRCFLQHFKCIASPDAYCVIKLLNIWIFHHILLFPFFADAVNYVATGCKGTKSPNICSLKLREFSFDHFPHKRISFQWAVRYWSAQYGNFHWEIIWSGIRNVFKKPPDNSGDPTRTICCCDTNRACLFWPPVNIRLFDVLNRIFCSVTRISPEFHCSIHHS